MPNPSLSGDPKLGSRGWSRSKPRGVPRVEGLRVISGIVHPIRSGLMGRDAPSVDRPAKTLCNRVIR